MLHNYILIHLSTDFPINMRRWNVRRLNVPIMAINNWSGMVCGQLLNHASTIAEEPWNMQSTCFSKQVGRLKHTARPRWIFSVQINSSSELTCWLFRRGLPDFNFQAVAIYDCNLPQSMLLMFNRSLVTSQYNVEFDEEEGRRKGFLPRFIS